jgi:trigger factor
MKNVVVKNISDTKVELTFVVGVEDLAIAAQVATTKLARDIKTPGFRKGKAPVAVAAKNIDPVVLEQNTLDNAISKAVADGFVGNEIMALERPVVEVTKYVPGETLEFKAEAEVLPKIKLGEYKKFKVATEKVEIKDSDIDEIVGRMLDGMAERKIVDRAAKTGDEVVIDFVGKKDGVAFDGGSGNDYNLGLGSNQFIPGFEDGIVGHKAGETFDLELTFPADYQVDDLKNAKTIFTTTLKSVKEAIKPELTDEFAAKVGPFKTADELRADIKRELTAQKERENSEKIKDDLVSQLVQASHVPVPDILVKDQMASIEHDFENNLTYQGLTIQRYLETKGFADKAAWIETEIKPVATKRVQAGLVLAELSKVEKIEASTDELEAHVDKYKAQYANNTDALKQFEQPEVRRDIANRLLTEKTVDRLVELNSKK